MTAVPPAREAHERVGSHVARWIKFIHVEGTPGTHVDYRSKWATLTCGWKDD